MSRTADLTASSATSTPNNGLGRILALSRHLSWGWLAVATGLAVIVWRIEINSNLVTANETIAKETAIVVAAKTAKSTAAQVATAKTIILVKSQVKQVIASELPRAQAVQQLKLDKKQILAEHEHLRAELFACKREAASAHYDLLKARKELKSFQAGEWGRYGELRAGYYRNQERIGNLERRVGVRP